ncbi:MAG: helix-turn-helix domain-containing protein [Treponema sp.]|nr:helix-turn-helix domain-containing protein [Treponema sp.]
MIEPLDLRAILARNIKNARGTLHITQAKLAEYADISLSSIIDIERCRTWVSDKTLRNIAKALNMEAYQLLIPLEKEHLVDDPDREKQLLEQIAVLVKEKQVDLRKTIDESMDELLRNIIQIYAG